MKIWTTSLFELCEECPHYKEEIDQSTQQTLYYCKIRHVEGHGFIKDSIDLFEDRIVSSQCINKNTLRLYHHLKKI